MHELYRITPLEKKNVELFYDVYEETDDNVRGWNVRELYRWGFGYRKLDDPVSEWELNNNGIFCDTEAGHGFEVDDLISVDFEFDEGFTEEEKQAIENNWHEGGAGWLYDGEHNWQIEDNSFTIYGPVQIDLIDEDTGKVLQENVPGATETANISWKTVSDQEAGVWPFPIDSKFGESDKNI